MQLRMFSAVSGENRSRKDSTWKHDDDDDVDGDDDEFFLRSVDEVKKLAYLSSAPADALLLDTRSTNAGEFSQNHIVIDSASDDEVMMAERTSSSSQQQQDNDEVVVVALLLLLLLVLLLLPSDIERSCISFSRTEDNSVANCS